MQKIESQAPEIKVGNITFVISAHFKEREAESVDQMLARLICQSSEIMITKPIS